MEKEKKDEGKGVRMTRGMGRETLVLSVPSSALVSMRRGRR